MLVVPPEFVTLNVLDCDLAVAQTQVDLGYAVTGSPGFLTYAVSKQPPCESNRPGLGLWRGIRLTCCLAPTGSSLKIGGLLISTMVVNCESDYTST